MEEKKFRYNRWGVCVNSDIDFQVEVPKRHSIVIYTAKQTTGCWTWATWVSFSNSSSGALPWDHGPSCTTKIEAIDNAVARVKSCIEAAKESDEPLYKKDRDVINQFNAWEKTRMQLTLFG